MQPRDRKIAFVLAASHHGTMIVNRFDHHSVEDGASYGVGFDILEQGAYSPLETKAGVDLLSIRRGYYGPGVVVIDAGANIGTHTIEWATAMTGWGSIIAIEAQERLYYALAGNIAINNCFNASAIFAAVGDEGGTLEIPEPDYCKPASFGSLELLRRTDNEFIGQAIDYRNTVQIRKVAIDDLDLPRVDLIKLDIEGMEMDALAGASNTIERCRPVLMIEQLKCDRERLHGWLAERGYRITEAGMNLLAIHSTDKTIVHLKEAA